LPWINTFIKINSCYPYEHKISSVNYLTECSHPLTTYAKEKELNIIQEILHNNEYNKNLSTRQPNQQKHRQEKTKSAIFIYRDMKLEDEERKDRGRDGEGGKDGGGVGSGGICQNSNAFMTIALD
jgi:hypothetical protein